MNELIPLRGRGAAAPLHLEVVRELTLADLDKLANATPVAPPVLQRIRAIHHRQAVLLAQGRSASEVASIVGTTPERVRQLQRDPAFAELVHQYTDSVMSTMLEDAARLRDKIIDVGELAIDEIRLRLEDEAKIKAIPIGELRKAAEFSMDRTVAPPKSAPPQTVVPQSITLNFGTTLKPRAAGESGVAGVTIDGEASETVETAPGSDHKA